MKFEESFAQNRKRGLRGHFHWRIHANKDYFTNSSKKFVRCPLNESFYAVQQIRLMC